jgi:hypothetical protein
MGVYAPRYGPQKMERGRRVLWQVEGLIPNIEARGREPGLRFTSWYCGVVGL